MKRKMLVVNDFPIYPPKFGGQFRLYYLYKNLSRWFDITYLCFSKDRKPVEFELSKDFREIRIPKSRIHRGVDWLFEMIFGKALDDIIAMFICGYDKRMENAVKSHASNSDIVVASHPYMYPVIKKYTENKFLIYEALNVEYVLKKAILGKGLFKRFLYTHVKRIEWEVINESDLIFTVSDIDRSKMAEVYNVTGSKIYLSPNGVDISAFKVLYENNNLVKEKVKKQHIAIFLGSAHPPNVEAVMNIIDVIAPRMKDIYFLICGSICWLFGKKKVGKNVGLISSVSEEEKLELYRISDVGLNPMQSGSGTNIKMLDYMAAGLPVIATPVGARGLDIENYEDALICDVSEFPEKIREVLDNRELYNKLSYNGRRLVEEKYDWEKIAEGMAKILEEKIEERGDIGNPNLKI